MKCVFAAVTVGGELALSVQNSIVRALERLTRLETNYKAQLADYYVYHVHRAY
jgi:hypothetical protein